MASIKIKGQQEPINLSQDRAKKVKAIVASDAYPNSHKIDLDTMVLEKGSIVGVFLEEEQKSSFVDIDSDEERRKILDYERELNGRHHLQYMIDEGIITADVVEAPGGEWTKGKPFTQYKNIIVQKPNAYGEIEKKNTGLTELKARRDFMRRNEPPPEDLGQNTSAIAREFVNADVPF